MPLPTANSRAAGPRCWPRWLGLGLDAALDAALVAVVALLAMAGLRTVRTKRRD